MGPNEWKRRSDRMTTAAPVVWRAIQLRRRTHFASGAALSHVERYYRPVTGGFPNVHRA